jgi:prepilin-type N-terminal cleavage/methylation domain-containing protein
MKKNGFSLIEVMTVIGVISAAALIGFPAIDNFGEVENYESDLATLRGQINIVRQISLEDGKVYKIKFVNDTAANTSSIEVWQAEGLDRFNTEYHKSTDPVCSDFNGTLENGTIQSELNKKLENMTVTKCDGLSGSCNAVSEANNSFCFLSDGSAPENSRAKIQSSSNAGRKSDYIHFYQSGFFNNGERM